MSSVQTTTNKYTYKYLYIGAVGFFAVGQFAVTKKKTYPNLISPNQNNIFFLTAKCPTAKNPHTVYWCMYRTAGVGILQVPLLIKICPDIRVTDLNCQANI